MLYCCTRWKVCIFVYYSLEAVLLEHEHYGIIKKLAAENAVGSI